MLNDITWVEKEFSPIIKNTLSLYAIESLSDKFLMSSDTALIRATKRGVLWTLAENLESEVLTQNSHLRNMDWVNLVDRSAWNAIIAGTIEVTNAYSVLDGALDGYAQQSDLRNAFETALLIYASRKLTDKFDSKLKNITSYFM